MYVGSKMHQQHATLTHCTQHLLNSLTQLSCTLELIDSASMFLHGWWSSFHAPTNKVNFCDHPLDPIRRGPAGQLNPALIYIDDIPIVHYYHTLTAHLTYHITTMCMCIYIITVCMCAWFTVNTMHKTAYNLCKDTTRFMVVFLCKLPLYDSGRVQLHPSEAGTAMEKPSPSQVLL